MLCIPKKPHLVGGTSSAGGATISEHNGDSYEDNCGGATIIFVVESGEISFRFLYEIDVQVVHCDIALCPSSGGCVYMKYISEFNQVSCFDEHVISNEEYYNNYRKLSQMDNGRRRATRRHKTKDCFKHLSLSLFSFTS